MKTSAVGYRLIKYWEQLHLIAYPDPASPLAVRLQQRGLWQKVLTQGNAAVPADLRGVSGHPWTIGYGDTGPHVRQDSVIDAAEAERRLVDRVTREFEPGINKALTREIQQCEYDALISWAYNVGVTAAATSTLMRMLNVGDDDIGTWLQLTRWVNAGGRPSLGLKRRRLSEMYVAYGTDVEKAIEDAVAFKE